VPTRKWGKADLIIRVSPADLAGPLEDIEGLFAHLARNLDAPVPAAEALVGSDGAVDILEFTSNYTRAAPI
jgi:hypothetical protein